MEVEEILDAVGTATILVVEDDHDTADFLTALLSEAGYQVEIAGDGPSALQWLDTKTPDLVLMDLMLPGVDGYTITEHIRSNALEALPIIMLTATGQANSKLRGFDAGADDFVVKPFLGEELLARIEVHLRRSRAVRDLEDQSSYLQQALELMTRREQAATSSIEVERHLRNELLHSVHTHLQSLCAVFDAEYRRQPPGAGREALQRVIPRLRGAALIYQISEALTGETADFDGLLRTIAFSLKHVYSPRKRIPIGVEAERVELPSSLASPLAMITSELVTNAFKHAFPHSRFGAITITCRRMGNRLQLEVADDGVGCAADKAGTSRGLAMVKQLIGELRGQFDLVTGATGTRVIVDVPIDPPAP